MFELAKDPPKNLLHSQCFNFEIQSYSSDLISRKKSAFLKRKLSLYSTAWAIFSKFWSSQQSVADSITHTKFWDWIYKSKRRGAVQALLERYSWAFEQTYSTIVPVWKKNKTCVFSIKKFKHYGDQFILIEVVNLGYREIKELYNDRFFVAYKCDIFESNYNV